MTLQIKQIHISIQILKKVDNLIKRYFDECTQNFQKIEYKCEFVVKFNHATHGRTNYFTLTKKFKNQHEEVNEANEIHHQIDEFEQEESGYIFDSSRKLTVKKFRYHDKRTYSYFISAKSFCSSTSLVNMKNDDNYCFLWYFLAHKHKVDHNREKKSHYKKHFFELGQVDIQFPMKIEVLPTFERIKNLNINVFELSAIDKTLSLKYVNKNYNGEQIDLLLYENHYCLITNLHNFCKIKEQYKNLCRRCSNTYGDQTNLEEHMFLSQDVLNKKFVTYYRCIQIKR